MPGGRGGEPPLRTRRGTLRLITRPNHSGVCRRARSVGFGAVVLGAGLRWNLAHRSLWWDELWNVKQTIVGRYDPVAGDDAEAGTELACTPAYRCGASPSDSRGMNAA